MREIQPWCIRVLAATKAILVIIAKWLIGVLLQKIISRSTGGFDDADSDDEDEGGGEGEGGGGSGLYQFVFLANVDFAVVATLSFLATYLLTVSAAALSSLSILRSAHEGRKLRDQILRHATGPQPGNVGTTDTAAANANAKEGDDSANPQQQQFKDIGQAASDLILKVNIIEDFQAYNEQEILVHGLTLCLAFGLTFVFSWYGGLIALLMLILSEGGGAVMFDKFRNQCHDLIANNATLVNQRLLDVIKNGVKIQIMHTQSEEADALAKLEAESDQPRQRDAWLKFGRDQWKMTLVGIVPVCMAVVTWPMLDVTKADINEDDAFNTGIALLATILLLDEAHKSIIFLTVISDKSLKAREARETIDSYLGTTATTAGADGVDDDDDDKEETTKKKNPNQGAGRPGFHKQFSQGRVVDGDVEILPFNLEPDDLNKDDDDKDGNENRSGSATDLESGLVIDGSSEGVVNNKKAGNKDNKDGHHYDSFTSSMKEDSWTYSEDMEEASNSSINHWKVVEKGDNVQRIVLDDVYLSYQRQGIAKPVFSGFHQSFRRGKIHGLVAESGKGKSSMLKIVAGLQVPQSGRMEIWAGMKLAYVSQDQKLFCRSIRENVSYGGDNNKIKDKEVWEALKWANIADWVKALPRGLNEVLKGGEEDVSGGQLQRLQLAHLYCTCQDADVILLDEVLSALDQNSRELMIDRLGNFLKGGNKTAIIVTHHSEMLRICDQVHEMQGTRGAIGDAFFSREFSAFFSTEFCLSSNRNL